MTKYNPNIHHRRSIRLKGYDYSQAGLYFITIVTQNREHLFGEIENGEIILNSFGKIAKEEWEKTAEIRENCSLGEFIIMPNHFHAIISIEKQIENQNKIGEFKSPSQTIGAIIRGFKGATTKKIKEYFLNNYHRSTGELPFAPTPSPFAPTPTPSSPTTEIIKLLENRILNKKSIWQRNYWEHIIRDEKAYHNISEYIIKNPENWHEDKLKIDR